MQTSFCSAHDLRTFYAHMTIFHQGSCVVPPPQESMDNGPSLFDYGLNDPYNDLIDDFDPYLKYGKGYQNRMAFEDAFYG